MRKAIKILILEDVPSDAELMQRELRKAGLKFKAALADTGARFIRQLNEFHPDIILADYRLPSFDALAALDVVREQAPGTPVIIVSGAIGEDLAVESLKRGACDYILKDRTAKLGEAVKRALQETGRQNELATAGKALRQSEERFRLIAETVSEVFWMADIRIGNMFYISPAYQTIWGRPLQSLYDNPRSFIEAIHPDDVERVLADYELKKTGRPFDHEYRILRPDGTMRWIWDRGFPVREQSGEVLRYVGIAQDITARRQSEQELDEIRRRYQALAGNKLICMYVHDFQGNFIDASQTALDLFGISREDIGRYNISAVLADQESRETAHSGIKLLLAGLPGRPPGIYHLRTAQGEDRYVTASATLVTRNGAPYAVMGAAVDITERRQAEEALRRSEVKYRMLFQTISDAIFIYELMPDEMPGKFTEVNDAACNKFGYSRQELLAMDLCDLQAPGTNLDVRGYVRKLLDNEDTLFERINRTKAGLAIPVEVHAHLFRHEGRDMIISLVRDITERKRTEQALQESEKKYRTVVDNMQDGVFIIHDGKMQFVNQAFAGIFGYTVKEITGMDFRKLVAPEDVDFVADRYRRRQAGEKVPREYEFRALHKDGHTRLDVNVNVELVTYNGKLGSMGTMRDITVRKRAENALRDSELRLKEAQTLGEIGNWEYDLKTGRIIWSDQMFALYERNITLGPPSAGEEAGYYRPEETQRLKELASQAITTGEEISFDLTPELPSGRQAYFYANMRPVKGPDGKISKLFGTVQDITGRKQAEQRMKKQLDELERWHSTMLDREKRVMELKREVNALLAKQGQPAKYGEL